jgi:hypothetical protein
MALNPKKKRNKVGTVMREFEEGTLKSSSGAPVTNRDQAIAIGISEQEDEEKRRRPKSRMRRFLEGDG